MADIDERVVAMSFENAKFEAGAAQTMATLRKLDASLRQVGTVTGLPNVEKAAEKVTFSAPMSALERLKAKLHFTDAKAAFSDLEGSSHKVTFSGLVHAVEVVRSKLHFPEANDAFARIEADADKVTLDGINQAVDKTSSHFSVLTGALAVALGNMATKIAGAGATFAKGFGLGPIMQGYDEYGLKLNAVQTLMSATGKGTKPVTAALQELNKYSDLTIYSFKDMIDNIPKFTNAGVPLGKAVDSLKGIAQVAAVSGASTEEAARSMYNLGQAIGQGTVRLQDWRSVELANMGTRAFKQQLIDTALAMGTLKKGTDGNVRSLEGNIVTAENFSSTLQDQWLKADVLTTTLQKYTDANTKMGKAAYASATNVKSLSQLLGIFKEQIGSGWGQSFELIFGNLDESISLWGQVNKSIGGFISASANARNKVLSDWKALGGRQAAIDGIRNAFEALTSVVAPLRDAFREVFPRATGAQLAELSKRFRDFMANLKIGPQTADALRRTFAGMFAVLHIGVTIVGDILKVFGHLLGVVGEGSGGFLRFTGGIGDFLVALDHAISKGKALDGLFSGLAAVLEVPLRLLGALSSAIFGLFTGKDNKGAERFSASLDDLGNHLKPLQDLLAAVARGFAGLGRIWDNLAQTDFGRQVAEMVQSFTDTVAQQFANVRFDTIASVIQTGLLGGIFAALRKGIGNVNLDVGGGLLKNISETFKLLNAQLSAMQRNIQANTLLQIALAIGVLAAGVLILSKIDPKSLSQAMGAIAVGLGELVGAVALLGQVMKGGGLLSMPILAASMIALAVAVDILAAAVVIFSKLSWEELLRGLAGVAGALAAISAGVKFMPKGLILMGPGLIAVAIAVDILAVAVKIFGEMSWDQVAKGLVGIAGALTAVSFGIAAMPKSLILMGPGLIALGIGLDLLAGAILAFGSIKLGTLAKGILGVSAALVAIGLAISLIPPTVGLQAAGLVILAVALNGIASAIAIMGKLRMETVVKGLFTMGASLIILALGLEAMVGTLPGAAALVGAAMAFALLAPALGLMGSLPWGVILKGLATMALTITVLSVAGIVAAPALTALGIAMVVLGAGIAVASAGIYILAKGLSLLSGTGVKGFAVLTAAVTAFVMLLPNMVINFIKGLVGIVAAIADLAPKIVDSLVKIVNSLIDVVTRSAPALATAAVVLISAFLKVVNSSAGPFIQAGLKLLVSFLSGIAGNIGRVTKQAALIVVRFLDQMLKSVPKIIASGLSILLAFLKGIGSRMQSVAAAGANIIVNFLKGVTSKIPGIVGAVAKMITTFLSNVSRRYGEIINAGTNLIVKFLRGIGDAAPRIVNAAVNMISKFIHAVSRGALDLVDVGFDTMIKFMNGLARAIRQNETPMFNAGWNIVRAIVNGMLQAVSRMRGMIISAVGNMISSLPKKALSILGIHSPSTVFREIGIRTMEGLALGLQSDHAISAISSTAERMVSTLLDKVSEVPDLLSGVVDMDPVITPVLDLSQVQKSAKQLDDLTNVVPITAAASYGQASAISADQAVAQAAEMAQAAAASTVTFEQNNYSPQALSSIEIYRQTRNQLAQAKTALGLPSQ